jgi:hypothetical protein
MNSTLLMTSRLLAFTLFLQGVEYFLLTRKDLFIKVWCFENLKDDLKFKFLFSDQSYKITTLLQLLLAISAFAFPQFYFFIGLFITTLLISIRFRGSFNGGSDMMSFVVLTGVTIGLATSNPEIQKFGLVYIAIHASYSYFKAGLAKIKQVDWRSGVALMGLAHVSLYPEIRSLKISKAVSLFLGWAVMAFELAIISLPFFPDYAGIYFVLAIVFHLVVFASFGLNRFFWIWMCAWPSIFFALTQIK